MAYRRKFNSIKPLANFAPAPVVNAPELSTPPGPTERQRILTAYPSGEIRWHDTRGDS
jgi:hypothetical protein